jgi:Inner membrane protein YgaP-like, transmembrane domain
MSIERWIRLIAGTFIVASVTLSYFHSRYWLLLTLFVGVNLFQSALTRWCLMEDILRKFGVGAEAKHSVSSHPVSAPS